MSEELIQLLETSEHFKNLPRKDRLRIAELITRLREVYLFNSLSDQELALIAQRGRLKRYERGELIVREGNTDRIFYVILKGQVRVWSRGKEGRRRLLNYHEVGDFFGELAFWSGSPRAANVDVVDDVDLVAFERDGFERIIQHAQISNYLRTWGRERIRLSNQPFPGKHWDEISVVQVHKSWVALAQVVFFPVMVILITLATSALLALHTRASSQVMFSVFVAVTVGMGLWIFWMWEDWHNDDFVVTSKRVIHIERILVPPFPVERHEATIDHVQDVTTHNHGLWTWAFGVQSLELKTAGAGTMRFPYLDDADRIREEIFKARRLAQVRRNIEERSRIRQALFPELDRPVKKVIPLESGETVKVIPEREGLLKAVGYFVPRTRVAKPDRIIWRKHWLILFRDVGPAVLLFVFSLALLVVGFVRPGILGRSPWAGTCGPMMDGAMTFTSSPTRGSLTSKDLLFTSAKRPARKVRSTSFKARITVVRTGSRAFSGSVMSP